jgi:hypothetical protein
MRPTVIADEFKWLTSYVVSEPLDAKAVNDAEIGPTCYIGGGGGRLGVDRLQ